MFAKVYNEEYECRLTMGSYIEYKNIFNIDFGTETFCDSNVIKLMYASTKMACKLDGQEFGLSLDEFCDGLSQDSYFEFCEKELMPQLKKNKMFQQRIQDMI